MTREEAIKALKMMNLKGAHPFLHWEEMMEVRDMAISALRQQETVTERHELTNADRIRAMSDEELAKLLCCTGWRMIEQKECLEWLQQPAEEDDHA